MMRAADVIRRYRAFLGLIIVLLTGAAALPAGPADKGANPPQAGAHAEPTLPPAALPTPPPAAAPLPAPLPAPAPPPAAPALPLRQGIEYSILPSARQNARYSRTLLAGGGDPPYAFSVVAGALPAGVALDAYGVIGGTPTVPGEFKFTVRVTDGEAKKSEQAYSLRVNAAAARVAPAPKPKPPATIKDIPAADADMSVKEATVPKVITYVLTEKDIKKALGQKPAEAPAPAGGAPGPGAIGLDQTAADVTPAEEEVDPARAKQRAEMLAPLKDTEYPSRELFEKALDARVCAYVEEIVRKAVAKSGASAAAAPAIPCPPPRAAITTMTGAPKPIAGSGKQKVSLADLPGLLMPPELRDALLTAARQEHFFVEDKDIRWTGGGCGCVNDALSGDIYGFYPFWKASGPDEQSMDFSLLTRIGYFALPFDDDGNFVTPLHWTESERSTHFIRVAQKYGTKVDLVLYRNDWTRLLHDEAKLDRIVRQLPRNALQAVDAPLTDWASWLKSWVPLFEPAPAMGDGVTVYFDGRFNDEDARRFDAFFRKFMLSLIAEMRASGRKHSLNIVVPDDLIGKRGAYAFGNLFEYLLRAEDPPMGDGRIAVAFDGAESRTNVDVRYLVLLSEPTTDSKKRLRAVVEGSPVLKGSNRKYFLRNMVPVISYAGADARQFGDDLIYFQDNFGGVGLWSLPLGNADLAASINQKLLEVFGETGTGAENPAARLQNRICTVVCPMRWTLRVVLGALLLMGCVSFGLLLFVCRGVVRTPAYLMYLGIGAVVTILLAVVMLNCDPGMQDLTRLLLSPWSWLAIGLAAIVLIFRQAYKPRYVKP